MSKEEFAAKLTPEQIANYPKIFKKTFVAALIVAVIILVFDAIMVFSMGMTLALNPKGYIVIIGLSLLVYIIAVLIIYAVIKAKYPYYKDSVYYYLKKQGKF